MPQSYNDAITCKNLDTHRLSIVHLTPWSRVLPKKPIFPHLMKRLTACTEKEGYYVDRASYWSTRQHPESDESRPELPTLFRTWEIMSLILITDHLLDGTWISPSFRISDENSALVFSLTSDKYSYSSI